MMRILPRLLGALLVIVLVVGTGVYFESQRKLGRTIDVDVAEIELPSASDEAALARGEHLAVIRACSGCHGADFGGETVIDDPMIGPVHAPNLTSGEGSVVADYTTTDWVRAIRHGLSRGGRPLQLMPSEEFTVMDADDLGNLIVYLESVPPVDRESPPSGIGPLGRVMLVVGEMRLAADVVDHEAPIEKAPDPSDALAYGEYLAATCTGCHGPGLSGGRIPGVPPDWPPAANLTPDEETGLGTWTEGDFVTALRTGTRPDGTKLDPVMPYAQFGTMNAGEMRSLWTYLKSLPVKEEGNR